MKEENEAQVVRLQQVVEDQLHLVVDRLREKEQLVEELLTKNSLATGTASYFVAILERFFQMYFFLYVFRFARFVPIKVKEFCRYVQIL